MSKKKLVQPENSIEPSYLVPPRFDGDGVQVGSGIGIDGKEYPDPVPNKPAVTLRQQASVLNQIKDFVHSERLRQLADAEGFDTEEEANDFEVEDEFIPDPTPYEKEFFPDPKVEAAASAAAAPSLNKPVASPDHESGNQTAVQASGKPGNDTPADTTPTGQPGSLKS